MWRTKLKAYLKQKKVYFNDDEIVNEENQFLAGLIEFEYESFKRVEKNKGNRVDKTEITYTLKTRADVDFKEGDMIKVNLLWYTVLSVTSDLNEKHNAFVTINPGSIERFTIKTLELI